MNNRAQAWLSVVIGMVGLFLLWHNTNIWVAIGVYSILTAHNIEFHLD